MCLKKMNSFRLKKKIYLQRRWKGWLRSPPFPHPHHGLSLALTGAELRVRAKGLEQFGADVFYIGEKGTYRWGSDLKFVFTSKQGV